MRKGTWYIAGALLLASAAPAHACNFYFASTFMKVPARPSFGVGVNGQLGDATVWGISGDVAMKLGEQAVVQPAIGICTGEGSSDPYFGAGFAYRLSNNTNMAVNLQSGISYSSFERWQLDDGADRRRDSAQGRREHVVVRGWLAVVDVV